MVTVMIVSGIYIIRNLRTNKVYIGSSQNIRKRLQAHKNLLCKNKHNNHYLQNAWNKYGAKSFEFKTLERVEKSALSRSQEFVVTSPAGERFTIIGLARFCRENGLDQGTMSRVAGGRAKSHKGWKCEKVRN